MPTNFYWFFIAALIPLLVGSLYYGPIFGRIWLKVNDFDEDSLKDGKLPRVLAMTYLLGLIIAFFMPYVVIHQTGVFSLMMPEVTEPGSDAMKTFTALMGDYAGSYRTFGHGVIHGVMTALFLVWPVVAINAMFERRGWKYVAIHVGYWVITLALMGGLLCQVLVYALPG